MRALIIGALLVFIVYAVLPNEVRAQTQTLAVENTESVYRSCVRYLREIKGIALPKGNAIDIEKNTYAWTVGNLMLFHYPDKNGDPTDDGHVAEIIKIRSDGLIVDECNFIGEGKCGFRWVSFNDPFFYGLFDPKIYQQFQFVLAYWQSIFRL